MENDATVHEIEEEGCNLADSGSSLQSECGGQKGFFQIFYAKETGIYQVYTQPWARSQTPHELV